MTYPAATGPLRKVLVANRGEIAARVLRACREMGIRSVAVYSEADAQALHVRLADEAYLLGPAPAAASYLSIARILEVAKRCGADSVHPGYGFLAENPAFAQACLDAGLVFVGPPPGAMHALGRKTEARQLAAQAGVPIVPGTLEPLATASEARAAAEAAGFPVALKAVAGGGGKGLRLVHEPDHLEQDFRIASSEALAAFGDGALYLERAILRARHVEVQILADHQGHCVYLGERDCSLQRRHQKLVEETPSPAVDPALRQRMGDVAVRVARAAGYVNAGTVEFLLAEDGRFYFLEVNTRLQVEHPITELTTGLDLVQQQLLIAGGAPLSFSQAEVQPRGYAVECRINAEDPLQGFLPATGTIAAYHPPSGPGIRVDSGIEEGSVVSVHYDSLLAKVIASGPDRPSGLRRMRRALQELLILGVRTNIPFHLAVLDAPAFASGHVDTGWLEREGLGLVPADETQRQAETAALAAALLTYQDSRLVGEGRSGDAELTPWQLSARRDALH